MNCWQVRLSSMYNLACKIYFSTLIVTNSFGFNHVTIVKTGVMHIDKGTINVMFVVLVLLLLCELS